MGFVDDDISVKFSESHVPTVQSSILVSLRFFLFNGISTFGGYLMPKPSMGNKKFGCFGKYYEVGH